MSDLGWGLDAETIEGLGADVFWNPRLSSLLVQHGDTLFSVQILIDSGDPDIDLQIAQELTAKVLERL